MERTWPFSLRFVLASWGTSPSISPSLSEILRTWSEFSLPPLPSFPALSGSRELRRACSAVQLVNGVIRYDKSTVPSVRLSSIFFADPLDDMTSRARQLLDFGIFKRMK